MAGRNRIMIKRWGSNGVGANENWIVEQRMVYPNEYLDGYEEISKRSLKLELEAQREPIKTFYENLRTAIVNIDMYWSGNYTDYKAARKQMKTLYAATTWESLNYMEKEVVIKWFVEIDQTKQLEVFTLDELLDYAEIYDKESTKARRQRYNVARKKVMFVHLDVLNALTLIKDIGDLVDLYIQGIEGTDKGDPEGLFDYLTSKTGTSYSGGGLLNSSITINSGITKQQLSDLLMDIFLNGNY